MLRHYDFLTLTVEYQCVTISWNMERITLQEFLSLPDHEQFEILENEGKFIEDRSDGNTKTEVYAIDRFFVEVEVNKTG